MAAESRRGSPRLETVLNEEGWRFDFFQTIRLLQLLAPESSALGVGDDPDVESVRVSSRVTMSFPPSEVHEIRLPEQPGEPADVVVNFMGLASPTSYGSLPMPYSELILSQNRNKNTVLPEFIDLFNHRLVSLFYRAWEKYRFAVVYEREGKQRFGKFEQALFSLMGLGPTEQKNGQALDSRALLARAHAVGSRGVSALGLAAMIQDYFGVPAHIEQFVPAWYEIEASEVCRLGRQSSHLGEDVCLGSRTRMAQSRFRVCLGPLSWRQMADFLPNGSAYQKLTEVCTLATGPEFDFEIKLCLASEHTPQLCLGVASENVMPRLGWSTWLQGNERDDEFAAVTINGELTAADLHLSV